MINNIILLDRDGEMLDYIITHTSYQILVLVCELTPKINLITANNKERILYQLDYNQLLKLLFKKKRKKMTCPLCYLNKTVIIDRINPIDINTLYANHYHIKISHILVQDLIYHHCLECDLRFFTLLDGTFPVGDSNFYNALNKLSWYYFSEKSEYNYAKQFIGSNDKVVEVGCGKAAFAKYLSTPNYVGLELSTDAKKMAQENGVTIYNQSIQEYAQHNPQSADIVCSFQVLEHVNNPHQFLSSQIKTLKGGGQLLIAVPSEDSFLQYVTNGILNMPPHHISRFSDKTLQSIAKIFNLKLISIYHESVQPEHKTFYKATMFSKRFFKPKLLDANPLRKITNRLGYIFENIPKDAMGHTVIATYTKPC